MGDTRLSFTLYFSVFSTNYHNMASETGSRYYRPRREDLLAYPGDYLSREFSSDVEYDKSSNTLNYLLEPGSETCYWADTFSNNILYQISDYALFPLTGFGKKMSGHIWAEGVSFAANNVITEQPVEKAVVSNGLWEREIENPEWHDITETVLQASYDEELIDNGFKKGAELFIDWHQ